MFVIYWLSVDGIYRLESAKVYKSFGNDEERLENQRKSYAKNLIKTNNTLTRYNSTNIVYNIKVVINDAKILDCDIPTVTLPIQTN